MSSGLTACETESRLPVVAAEPPDRRRGLQVGRYPRCTAGVVTVCCTILVAVVGGCGDDGRRVKNTPLTSNSQPALKLRACVGRFFRLVDGISSSSDAEVLATQLQPR